MSTNIIGDELRRVAGVMNACVASVLFFAAIMAFLFYKWFYLSCPDERTQTRYYFSLLKFSII
ncbi:MAG: hypothetical protein PVI26_08155 [Chitinispirillia bacterium]|jgi:hypothetical protein